MSKLQSGFGKVLGFSRYFSLFAVVGALIGSIVTLFYGAITTFVFVFESLFRKSIDTYGAKHLALGLVEIIDLYLIGTILYIFALGVYELFVDPDIQLPSWLQIKSISQLKTQLVGVLAVMIAVTFVGNVVEWDGSEKILELGVASGIVILALAVMQWLGAKKEIQQAEGD